MALDHDLVEILRCPKCKGTLLQRQDPPSFDCEACQLRYEIIDDIPNFLINEAKPLTL